MVNLHSGDVIVEAFEDRRIPVNEQKPDLFYYQCRHSETDWSIPCAIERNMVWANFWGTVASREPLNFDDDDVLNLTEDEGSAITFLSQALELQGEMTPCAVRK